MSYNDDLCVLKSSGEVFRSVWQKSHTKSCVLEVPRSAFLIGQKSGTVDTVNAFVFQKYKEWAIEWPNSESGQESTI